MEISIAGFVMDNRFDKKTQNGKMALLLELKSYVHDVTQP
jgi:hypothetical protein